MTTGATQPSNERPYPDCTGLSYDNIPNNDLHYQYDNLPYDDLHYDNLPYDDLHYDDLPYDDLYYQYDNLSCTDLHHYQPIHYSEFNASPYDQLPVVPYNDQLVHHDALPYDQPVHYDALPFDQPVHYDTLLYNCVRAFSCQAEIRFFPHFSHPPFC
jgi:hypothetical protein